MKDDDRFVRISTAIYGWLLRAYPRSCREQYGVQMSQTFGDLCRCTLRRRGCFALIGVWLAVLADTGKTFVTEHIAERKECMAPKTLKGILYSHLWEDPFWTGFIMCLLVCSQCAAAAFFIFCDPPDTCSPEVFAALGYILLGSVALMFIVGPKTQRKVKSEFPV